MNIQLTCKKRIDKHYASTMETLRKLYNLYCEGDEEGDPDYGMLPEYGLCIDVVESDGQYNDGVPYVRYQLSTGGPGDEFRYYLGSDGEPYAVEYWFLDWFDGAEKIATGADKQFLFELYENFLSMCITKEDIEEVVQDYYWNQDNDEEDEY